MRGAAMNQRSKGVSGPLRDQARLTGSSLEQGEDATLIIDLSQAVPEALDL